MSPGLAAAVLVAPVVALGVLALRPGGLAAIGRIRVHGFVWVLVAAAVQALRTADPAWASSFLHAAGGAVPALVLGACAVGFVLANTRGRPRAAVLAAAVAGLGAVLNAAATAINGGMPFSVAAARTAGIDAASIADPTPGHVPIDAATRLVAFADVVPVPGLHLVFSVGDVLLWAGLAACLVVVALRRPADVVAPPADSGPELPGVAGVHHSTALTSPDAPSAVARSTA